jgi:hypothetical protein
VRTHTANGVEIACRRESAGSCRICELTDPDSPSYRADYARLYSGGATAFAPTVVDAAAGTPTEAWTAGGQPCCGGQPPGLLAKVTNFARAAFEHVKAGSPEADEPTASARLAICLGCEHLDARTMTCNICGCEMPRKVYWLEQHCPIGKW